MAKATENKPVEEVVEAVDVLPEKPYTFRKLSAPDVFLMAQIIGKIGVNEFTACFEKDGIKNMIANMMGNGAEGNQSATVVGFSVILEIASVICGNLPKCENEIYQMLANTSNMTVDEIKAPGNAVLFFEMVVDFIKKEEFKDFIKVVSRLFK